MDDQPSRLGDHGRYPARTALMFKQLCFYCRENEVQNPIADFYRCVDCFNDFWPTGVPLLPSGLMTRTKYWPGFRDDLKSWETDVYSDGTVVQQVCTRKLNQQKPTHETRSILVVHEKTVSINQSLAQIDMDSLSLATYGSAFSDFSEITIISPQHGVWTKLPCWNFDTDDISVSAKLAAKNFAETWKLIDGLIPGP